MGGDAPQNRRQEYKKQQKREAGGREGRERQADGKPVHVKGIGTYQKPAPAFVETMLAAYAKKNQADPATAKMSGGIEAIMGISDGRSERDQWPSRDPESEVSASRRSKEQTVGNRQLEDPVEVARRRLEEQQRYQSGRGVQAAGGQMRVIIKRKITADANVEDAAGSVHADGQAAADAGDQKQHKKKKKAKNKKANTKLLSFGLEDDAE